MTTTAVSSSAGEFFGWWRGADSGARRALAAGMFGWMLDAFDVMLFALVLPAVRADLGLTSAQGGFLGSGVLVAPAGGGVAFWRIPHLYLPPPAPMLTPVLHSAFPLSRCFAP